MKSLRRFVYDARRHKGLALIIVLSMLALATIVILAFLSVADTEHKGTMTYSASQTARRYADTAVNIVISQIQAGSDQDTSRAGRETHSTQPGAVRKYADNGSFLAGYKLFSDSEMIFTSTGGGVGTKPNEDERTFLLNSEPPGNWNQGANLVRYVDMNEPVIKGVLNAEGEAGSAQVYFPVLDPRAAFDMDPAGGNPVPAEGFTYETTTALNGGDLSQKPDGEGEASKVSPIVKPAGAAPPDTLRLAMPVKWLYMLKDGTLGTLDDSMAFQSSGDSQASEATPIVGRIAFWTDDESCKININTAAEPTFMGQPTFYHERDHRWADYPAARNEYQRFPGHPATVALSSVLYPNPFQSTTRNLDTYGLTSGSAGLTQVLGVKNRIYAVAPRINSGGSNSGTKLFAADDYNSGGSAGLSTDVDLTAALNERIYASVDELFFSETNSGGLRVPTVTDFGGGNLFNKQTLERASGFLTAHSRSSEISMLGLPRIAMWPVNKSASKRTPFDNLITFCSTLGKANFAAINLDTSNTYIFQRETARDATHDIGLQRNQKLLGMLDQILATARFPAETLNGGNGNTFKTKLRNGNGFDNYRQVIVEMFDYIRSTNLQDSYQIPNNRASWPASSIYWGDNNLNLTGANIYDVRDNLATTFNTYTPGVVKNAGNPSTPFADVALPGHGQVTPAVWNVGGQNYRGFGRSVSISEIGLHFICTGDGQPDMYSWRHLNFKNDPDPTQRGYEIMPINSPSQAADQRETTRAQLYNAAVTGQISGGRTALKVENDRHDDEPNSSFLIEHSAPLGFQGAVNDNSKIINAGAQFWNNAATRGDVTSREIKERYYSNFPPLSSKDVADGLYGTVGGSETDTALRGKHRNFHPGTQESNWNYTLDQDTPLGPNPGAANPTVHEKRIQAMFHLEFFCPSVGYTQITPEFAVVINGQELSSIEAGGVALFPGTEPVVLKSAKPIFQADGTPEVGGYASFRRVAGTRGLPARGQNPGVPADALYSPGASDASHLGIMNLDLVSGFFTVPSDNPLSFQSGRIRIDVYDSHNWRNRSPMQTLYFSLPKGEAPTPDLVVQGSHVEYWVRESDSVIFNHPTVQAPHWWAFHQGGALGRLNNATVWPGRLADPNDPIWNGLFGVRTGVDGDTARNGSTTRNPGRQSLPGCRALIYGWEPNNNNYRDVRRSINNEPNPDTLRATRAAYDPATNYNTAERSGSDVVRTIQPGHGDARLIAGKAVVQETDWSPHVLYNDERAFLAHNFSSYNAGSEVGFDRTGDATVLTEDATKRTLPQTVNVASNRAPDAPYSGRNDTNLNGTTRSLSPAYLSQRYFDFDDSDPGGRSGTFINKPDEGNYAVGDFTASGWPKPVEWRATYFRADSHGARFAAGAKSFFTPNRMISSPVMMGSLPSRLHSSNMTAPDATSGGNGAWTNLLFRPHVQITGAAARHPGQVTPPDHYLLDMFWMPVVEPYAISEPLSTAGKINMNYQMMPFTHIRRATALHAAMKGEQFAAIPNADYTNARTTSAGFGPQGRTAPIFRDEAPKNGRPAARWYRSIAIDRMNNESGGADTAWWNTPANQRVQATLRQFEERFNFTSTASGTGGAGIGGSSGGLPASFRGGLFRSASQICEIHLIPSRVSAAGLQTGTPPVPSATDTTENIAAARLGSYADREDAMVRFWSSHSGTGDNTRERPYSNLYAKLTTRSNTFRVHVRAQTVKKAVRGPNVASFNPAEDLVTGEFRGSFLLERYVDLADLQEAGTKADFTSGNPLDENVHPPLDSYYRYRVLESKRFAP
ncbi:MAG: Verru_Chthon cassette protein A [Prosthecobacter sp.]